MELTVASRNVTETDDVLREIFEKRNIQSEMRKVDPEDSENPIGKIVYFLSVGGDHGTDKLSEEIFASDPSNIDSIQWGSEEDELLCLSLVCSQPWPNRLGLSKHRAGVL